MNRRHDWPERLNAYLDSIRYREFTWEALDCCTMPMSAIRAMTDEDPAWWFRGQYTTGAGAIRCLRKFAGGLIETTIEKLAAHYGWEEIGFAYMQRGDLVIVRDVEGDGGLDVGLGICIGRHVAVMSDKGLAAIPMKRALRAWRI